MNDRNYSNIWWAVPGVLAGMGMPYVDPQRRMNFGGALCEYDDDLHPIYAQGIRAVVCLLNIPTDEKVFKSAGFDFQCLPIMDGCPPDLDQVKEFVAFMESQRLLNLPVAVFCEAGLGRTGTMVAAYLIHKGKSALEAIQFVRSREPAAIETSRQIKFLEEF